MLFKALTIAMTVCIGTLTALALNPPAGFILIDDNTAIQKIGAPRPFMSASQLPDTAPPYFPHSKELRFVNKKFHFISVSPSQELIAFATGEEHQWLGMMNVKDRYMKFLAWGWQTKFLDATWSPDGKYLEYAALGPDKRTLVNIIETPSRDTAKPTPTNVWFKIFRQGSRFKPIGWIQPGDTVFTFAEVDSLGNEMIRTDLNLHFNPSLVPEHMNKAKAEPSGSIQLKD